MAVVNQDKIEHTIGEPIFMMASGPIESYDQLTNTWSAVTNAQSLGYVPSAKMRLRNPQGLVVGTFVLTWATADLWRLKLDTTSISFVPGEYTTDLKVTDPSGDVVYSKQQIFVLNYGNTR